ncbi:MAG: A/G-specific adenine glycosylase [Candidatus Saccharibacteria bacterium]
MKNAPSQSAIVSFQQTVWQHDRQFGRPALPWRDPQPDGTFDPYRVVVSELMLQQTTVGRVRPKYIEFLEAFPTVAVLAAAPLGDVLRVWNGLGYNRRAKFLHHTAQAVVASHGGHFPSDRAALIALPGIGPNTAGAILAYAFNQPAVYIETNIRTVYLYHFFRGETAVADRDILVLVALTLDPAQPRDWYGALMDYGTHLKQTAGQTNRASRSYRRQSTFLGSSRALRGAIISRLSAQSMSRQALAADLADERCDAIVSDLLTEGLIQQNGHLLTL